MIKWSFNTDVLAVTKFSHRTANSEDFKLILGCWTIVFK